MVDTFDKLGIPFPLFQAEIREAAEYIGHGDCTICRSTATNCFRLAIGGSVIVSCPSCHSENALDAGNCDNMPCRICRQMLSFPMPTTTAAVSVCYSCLRAGKAALTKDTELGMVRWEDAIQGWTFGIPATNIPGYETKATEDGWLAAQVEQNWLLELLRTPAYTTWQGEQWLFCCQRPMVYLGAWDTVDFNAHALDGNGRALFDQIVTYGSDALWHHQLHDATGVYVFRCPVCQTMRAHWDIA